MKQQLIFLSILIFFFGSSTQACASDMPHEIKTSIGLANAGYMSGVGAVISEVKPPCKHSFCIRTYQGSGTYIGGRQILTAAHILKEYLPSSTMLLKGPLRIPLKHGSIYWTNYPNSKDIVPVQNRLYATHIVVDARAIHLGLYKDEREITRSQMEYDLAILTLEKAPDPDKVQRILFASSFSRLPKLSLTLGYGKREGHKLNGRKHALFQTPLHIKSQTDKDKGIIVSPCVDQNFVDSASKDAQLKHEAQILLQRNKVHAHYYLMGQCTSGDSGGPLLAVAQDGDIRIIGVLSASSEKHNFFTTIVSYNSISGSVARSIHFFDPLLEKSREPELN